jgi:hypothetical protein
VSAQTRYSISGIGCIWRATDEDAVHYGPDYVFDSDGAQLWCSDERIAAPLESHEWVIVEWDAVPGGGIDGESAWYRWAFRYPSSDMERNDTWEIIAREIYAIRGYWCRRSQVLQVPWIDAVLLPGLRKLARSPIVDIFAAKQRYRVHLRWLMDVYEATSVGADRGSVR